VSALLAALALTAALLGGAGALTLFLEARLASLSPGGLAVSAIHYNPFTGRLALAAVSARDEAGREIFRADAVQAIARLRDVFGAGPLTLQRVHVVAPRLVIAPQPALTLIGLGAPAAAGPPVIVDGISVSDGALVVEAARPGRALVIRDLSARLDRLSAEGESEPAFAIEMAVYGSSARVTGQPLGGGAYALRVRAQGLDAPALLADFPDLLAGTGMRLAEGRADVDATLVIAGARRLASGQLRVNDLVARFAEPRSAPLTAAALVLAVDRWDLEAGAVRISRLELRRPSFTLGVERGAPAGLAALLQRLTGPGVALRRLRIVDGTVRLVTADAPLTLRRLTLGLQSAAETGPHAGFVLTARAGVGGHGRLALEGALSRDFRRAAGAVRAIGVTLDGCGLEDISVPLPPEASPRAVLAALTDAGCAQLP
jgi:hypothetical protein